MYNKLYNHNFTIINPWSVCGEGRSKMSVLLVKIGFLTTADISVCF